MWKSIAGGVGCLVLAICFNGCGSSSSDSPKPLVNPSGNYTLSYTQHMYTVSEGQCAAGPTNGDAVTIVVQQNGNYTWTQGNLSPVAMGTMTCTSDNCVDTVSLNGMLNIYTYTYDVTILSSGMTGTLMQHGPACDDRYVVTGTKL